MEASHKTILALGLWRSHRPRRYRTEKSHEYYVDKRKEMLSEDESNDTWYSKKTKIQVLVFALLPIYNTTQHM
jgi:hypothetical protein